MEYSVNSRLKMQRFALPILLLLGLLHPVHPSGKANVVKNDETPRFKDQAAYQGPFRPENAAEGHDSAKRSPSERIPGIIHRVLCGSGDCVEDRTEADTKLDREAGTSDEILQAYKKLASSDETFEGGRKLNRAADIDSWDDAFEKDSTFDRQDDSSVRILDKDKKLSQESNLGVGAMSHREHHQEGGILAADSKLDRDVDSSDEILQANRKPDKETDSSDEILQANRKPDKEIDSSDEILQANGKPGTEIDSSDEILQANRKPGKENDRSDGYGGTDADRKRHEEPAETETFLWVDREAGDHALRGLEIDERKGISGVKTYAVNMETSKMSGIESSSIEVSSTTAKTLDRENHVNITVGMDQVLSGKDDGENFTAGYRERCRVNHLAVDQTADRGDHQDNASVVWDKPLGITKPAVSRQRRNTGKCQVDITEILDSGRPVSSQMKLDILTNHWEPTAQHVFPITVLNNKQRRFRGEWLKNFRWLCYSPSTDGAFCTACVCFPMRDDLDLFVKRPYRHWTKANEDMKKHQMKQYHKDSMIKAESFVANMRDPAKAIDVQVNDMHAQRIKDNRAVLKSVVNTVLFCGRQGLPLRGHRDDGLLDEDNHSNFNALICFRIESGDTVLQKHIASSHSGTGHATYISKTTQNNIIELIGDYIRDKLLADIKTAKTFSLLADEVCDTANWEQLAIVLRFVDSSQVIRQEFLAFVPCEQITGEALTGKILGCLEEWGLQVEDIRGQGYDGGSNMAAKYKGVQARIRELNEKAVYFHCAAHCLSLCIVKACDVQSIRNMFGTMKQLSLFFSLSPKRQRFLEHILEACDITNKRKLVDLCRTRWIETHNAFETLTDLFTYVYRCLEGIENKSEDWDSETLTKCQGLRAAITSSAFMVSFVVTRNCLRYIKPLSVNLQKKTRDIVEAYAAIEGTASALADLRGNLDDVFKTWFTQAVELAESVHENVAMPRTACEQTLRQNQPADTPEQYFRRRIAVPFLDHLLSEFSSRFKNAELVKDGLMLVADQAAGVENACRVPEGITCLADLWASDLPDSREIPVEFHRWCVKWKGQTAQPCPSTIAASLLHCHRNFFPNLHVILRLLATLPVTTAECERSISGLKLLKTSLRSTMTNQRLNGLALMRLHREIEVDAMAIVDAFARKFKTRMATLLPRHLLQFDC